MRSCRGKPGWNSKLPESEGGDAVLLVALLGGLLTAALSWYFIGWAAAGVVVCAWFQGVVYGHEAVRAIMRRDGYVVDHRPDMTGRHRWRVGVAEGFDPATGAAVVRWIAPGGRPASVVNDTAREARHA